MKKKIFKSFIFVGIFTTIFFTLLGYKTLSDSRNRINNIFNIETKNISIEIKNKLDQHQDYAFENIKANFKKNIVSQAIKDSETLAPLIEEFSIFGAREFLSTNFQNIKDLVSARLIVVDEKNYQLWQSVGANFLAGLNLDTQLDLKSRKWKGRYLKKKIELPILFLDDKNNLVKQLIVKEINVEKKEGTFEIVSPIKINGNIRGVLVYIYSVNSILESIKKEKIVYQKIQDDIKNRILVMQNKFEENDKRNMERLIIFSSSFILILLVLTIIYSNYTGDRLTKPIFTLNENMDKVGQGIYEEVPNIESNDEIEDLSKKFNKMVSDIKTRDQKLLDYQNNLENILDKRTKELEEERAHNIQESKLRSIGEMAAGVAHEINNPLAVILPNVSIVEKIMGKDKYSSEKVDKALNNIKEMIHRISKIVQSIKSFTREQKDEVFELVQVKQIIDSSLTILEQRMRAHNIKLDVDYRDDLELEIICREIEISQVFINLLNNAFYVLKDLPDKNERWIKVNVLKEPSEVKIEVLNGGDRINPDIVEKIMEPFFTTKPVGEGTGLGLSISRGILNSHGGDLYIDMTRNNTCFVMSFPEETGS